MIDEGPGRGLGHPLNEHHLHMLKKNHDDSSSVKDESEDAPTPQVHIQADYMPAARKDRKRPKAMTQYQPPSDSVDKAERQGS